jgi:hypothetical protein
MVEMVDSTGCWIENFVFKFCGVVINILRLLYREDAKGVS